MKTELTIEESAKLIELGVDPKLASGHTLGVQEYRGDGIYKVIQKGQPIFKLTDILAILEPATRELGGIFFGFSVERGTWVTFYDDCDESEVFGEELIDSLYQLLIWCITNHHYNPKNKEK